MTSNNFSFSRVLSLVLFYQDSREINLQSFDAAKHILLSIGKVQVQNFHFEEYEKDKTSYWNMFLNKYMFTISCSTNNAFYTTQIQI